MPNDQARNAGARLEGLRWDFFIAHADADTAVARTLDDALQSSSRVFFDKRCLELGTDFDTELANAQRASLVTVVLVSRDTQAAYYEREEIAAALNLARSREHRHRVVPIYLEEAAASREDLPYGLRLKQGLTLSAECTIEDASRKLLELLGRIRDAVAHVDPAQGRQPLAQRND